MPDYRASWYSQLPPFGWFDPQDRPGSNALRVPDWQQGIALPSRRTLGQWFNVTPPGGGIPYPQQQTDTGPAPWTGRGVDISAAAANQMGYTPRDFPTNASFKIEPRDEPRALGSPAGLPVQAGDQPGADLGEPYAGPAGGRKMPDNYSLYDLLGGGGGGFRGLQGNAPASFGDALAQRSNSLIGLGLGLMSAPGMAGALQGFQAGANTDALNAYRQAQTSQHAAELAFRKGQAAIANEQWRQQFERGGETEFEKAQRDIARYRGTPQEEEVKRHYAAKMGEAPQLVKIYDENLGEDVSALFNPRSPPGQQFTDLNGRPINAPSAARGITPAFGGGGGAVPFTGNAPFGTGFQAAPAAPAAGTPSLTGRTSPADLPPRQGPKAMEPEQKLRKEFTDTTKVHQEVRQSFGRVMSSENTPAGDVALLYGYIKLLDPRTGVREGETATAEQTAGIPQRIIEAYNKALTGHRLSTEQRRDFLSQSTAIYNKYQADYDRLADQYRGIARQYRLDPNRIIPDLPAMEGGGGPAAQGAGGKDLTYNPRTGKFE